MSDYFRLSPHHDERPENSKIKLLVIHNISLPPNSFDGPWIDDLFMARLDITAHPYFKQLDSVKVSAHQLIRRNGDVIQYVPFDKRAWHAGISSWQGLFCILPDSDSRSCRRFFHRYLYLFPGR